MLHASGLTPDLWNYAFKHAAWILNRLVHAGATKTPIELATLKRPLLTMLRPFACRAFLYDHTHLKQMTPYARQLHHLGVCPDSKGWLFYNKDTHKLTPGISAKFVPPEARVHGIEALSLGDFTLGDELDQR